MSADRERERWLLEGLDRVLSGEETVASEAHDEDTRSALDLARKIASLREDPRPEFKANLKARLIEKLHEQEAGQREGGWLWRLMRQPVWQAVTVFVALLVLGGVLWRTAVFEARPAPTQETQKASETFGVASAPPMATMRALESAGAATPAPSRADRAAGSIEATGNTDKASYAAGDTVTIEVAFRNSTIEPVSLEGSPPGLSVKDAVSGQTIRTLQTVRAFSAGSGRVELPPGESVSFSFGWENAPPGEYYLELESIVYQDTLTPLVLLQPVKFSVLPR